MEHVMPEQKDAALTVAQLVAAAMAPEQPDDDDLRIHQLSLLVVKLPDALTRADGREECVEQVHWLVEYLLAEKLHASDDDDDDAALQTAKWRVLTKLLRIQDPALRERVLGPESTPRLLRMMQTDRFLSSEVLTAMAECTVQLAAPSDDNASLLDVRMANESGEEIVPLLELVKQMYVTLDGHPNLRQQLTKTFTTHMTTKEHAKHVVRSGLLRTLLQIALEQPHVSLLRHFESLATRVASLTCYNSTPTPDVATTEMKKTRRAVCESVVTLMLSGVSLVFAEGVRLLQLLLDEAPYRELLPVIPDLRGALEKAHTLARLKDSKLAHDAYLSELCAAQYQALGPEIDAFERQHGSVVGLPLDDAIQDGERHLEHALRDATACKTRGNVFFRRGNFSTARVFYRRAMTLLRSAKLLEESSLRSLEPQELLTRCSVGASVQVRCASLRSPGHEWQDAMVSDVEEVAGREPQLEVLYDSGEQEDEWVSLSRVRLRMNTPLLAGFEDLTVDCCMNMGKAFAALGEHDQAAKSFSEVLARRSSSVAALYYRGVAHLALHDLNAAQKDLWAANQACRAQQKRLADGPGQSKTDARDGKQVQALHKQIVVAYKRLQLLHKHKKRLDKKLVKQMVSYLATVPGLQEEDEAAETST